MDAFFRSLQLVIKDTTARKFQLKMSTNTDHLSYVKTAFRLSGYLPSHKTFHTRIYKFFLTPVMSVLCLFTIYNLRYMHHNIFEIAATFESLSTHGHVSSTTFLVESDTRFQVFGRKLAILKHAKLLEEIITDRRFFWNYDTFGEELKTRFNHEMSIRNFIIKSLSGISVVMLTYFFLTPVFAKNVALPQAAWIPGNTTLSTTLMYIFQIVCISESIPVAIIIDGTFLLMCGEMEIQFTLLKKLLLSVEIGKNGSSDHQDTCFQKLKTGALYHSFLLKYVDLFLARGPTPVVGNTPK